MSSSKVDDLEPQTRLMCKALLELVNEPIPRIKITETLRSFDKQNKDYAQGRFTPGPIITHARGGESPHNFGLAFDWCFVGKTLEECYPNETDPRWVEVGKLGESLGLDWGGPNGKGDRFIFDRPHFQRKDWKSYIPRT